MTINSLRRKILLAVVVLSVLAIAALPSFASAKTFTTKQFRFTYPNNWTLSKSRDGSQLYLEPKTASKKKTGLADTATFYRVEIFAHYETALNFSDDQKTALAESLGAMADQYVKETVDTFHTIAVLYPGTYSIVAQSVKNFRIHGNAASRTTITEKIDGKKIVEEMVFISKDRKTVYAISGGNSRGSVTPRKKTFDNVVKSFRILR